MLQRRHTQLCSSRPRTSGASDSVGGTTKKPLIFCRTRYLKHKLIATIAGWQSTTIAATNIAANPRIGTACVAQNPNGTDAPTTADTPGYGQDGGMEGAAQGPDQGHQDQDRGELSHLSACACHCWPCRQRVLGSVVA